MTLRPDRRVILGVRNVYLVVVTRLSVAHSVRPELSRQVTDLLDRP